MEHHHSTSDGPYEALLMPEAVPNDRSTNNVKGFFSLKEEDIYQHWKDHKSFKKQLEMTSNRPHFTFYDGPPFATGLPHYGHILAGTIKDVMCRYMSMNGFYVSRRFGWDCHGLPIEHEIDKEHQISGPEAVKTMGLRAYNDLCRGIVMKYSIEWEKQITRFGRWIDFEHDYKTMYPWFMESVWFVFKQLWSKGQVYPGYKIMPYSTACTTPLSNFEVGQNYQEVDDPAITVTMPLVEDPAVSLIVWTTTPWTLPSNLAACVNPTLTYVKLKDAKTSAVYIMMEARVSSLYKKEEDYIVLDKFLGCTLAGKAYTPPFNYFKDMAKNGAFTVRCDDYVTDDAGTGVVHQAPYFGEDDFRVCLRDGIITKETKPICPVDAAGRFTDEVPHFKGQHVKAADKNIINHLKSAGRLVKQERLRHQYPFCWRSNTPLIYKAVPSFFVRVEEHQKRMLKNLENTYWVPSYVKEKRFYNWVKDSRDWCIGRNRYWGTPIPLWTNVEQTEWVCVGSKAELEKLTGHKIDDLHRDYIDDLTIPSADGKSQLRRVDEVFDCWFESGSMPYAQAHFPFENEKQFHDIFPADFIAEGIDQTRGWFYTLLVIGTHLFDMAPFKNLIVNGLVLAADGQKMSKSKRNFPDPMNIVNEYGADAMRLYLINSPVVRGENLRFKDEGVRDTLKDVILPWYNAYRFFVQNVLLYEQETGEKFVPKTDLQSQSNMMDKWIISYSNSLVNNVRQEMDEYNLSAVVPVLLKYIDMLTNWYVRMNRRRFKCDTCDKSASLKDTAQALETLYYVLMILVRLMAPLTPFLCEHMYLNLRRVLPESQRKSSVHHTDMPTFSDELIDKQVEDRVSAMQSVVDTARTVRDREGVGLKYPLRELVVIPSSEAVKADVEPMIDYIKEEVNVRAVNVTLDKSLYGVQLKADLNYKSMGEKLQPEERKQLMQKLSHSVKNMSTSDLEKFVLNKSVTLFDKVLTDEDINVVYSIDTDSANNKNYKAHSNGQFVTLLDMSADQTMLDEGLKREIVNRMQKQRKQAHLLVTDSGLEVYTTTTPADGALARVLNAFKNEIESTTKQTVFINSKPTKTSRVLDQSDFAIKCGNEQETLNLLLIDTRPPSLNAPYLCNEHVNGPLPENSVRIVYKSNGHNFEEIIPLKSNSGKQLDFDTLTREIRAAFSDESQIPFDAQLACRSFRIEVVDKNSQTAVPLNKANWHNVAEGSSVVTVLLN